MLFASVLINVIQVVSVGFRALVRSAVFACIALGWSPFIYADSTDIQPVLRSAVPTEFQKGLQYKQMLYVAEQLGMQLKLMPMPLARRIHALKRGDIDIMIALKKNYPSEGKFTYLQPSYEQIESSLFVRQRSDPISYKNDAIVLGLTIDNNYDILSELFSKAEFVKVSTLSQKLDLLRKNRIDAFLHFRQSGVAELEKQGIAREVTVVSVPELDAVEYYIGLSHLSPHFEKKQQFEQVIQQAVNQGVFAHIRALHYEENSRLTQAH